MIRLLGDFHKICSILVKDSYWLIHSLVLPNFEAHFIVLHNNKEIEEQRLRLIILFTTVSFVSELFHTEIHI